MAGYFLNGHHVSRQDPSPPPADLLERGEGPPNPGGNVR